MTVGNNFRQKIHQFFFGYDDYEWVSAKASTFFPKKKNRAFNILRFNDALHIVLNEKYSL